MVATGQVVTGGGAPHTHGWSEITGEPDTFPPATHTHTVAIADVTGLGTALAGKAATSHTHVTGDVTGLSAALNAKADEADLEALDSATSAALSSKAPAIKVWNGTAYVSAPLAEIYVGTEDPGDLDTGSVWIGPE